MSFYVYSDTVTKLSRVHREECGNYMRRKLASLHDNWWHGPHGELNEALVAGITGTIKQSQVCKICLGNSMLTELHAQ